MDDNILTNKSRIDCLYLIESRCLTECPGGNINMCGNCVYFYWGETAGEYIDFSFEVTVLQRGKPKWLMSYCSTASESKLKFLSDLLVDLDKISELEPKKEN